MKKYNLESSVESECMGGGRIQINKEEKTIFVYGYSQGNNNVNN